MKELRVFTVLIGLFLLQACAYDSEDELIALDEIGTDGEDDNPSESSITYESTIKAIVDSNCISCHSNPPRNGAPFGLVNFSQVSGRANGILNAISRQSGSPGAMPPAQRLPQNSINQFQEWIDEGTPEN